MRWICAAVVGIIMCGSSLCGVLNAGHPEKQNQPVHPRVDVIGPLGNRLPTSYRRRYNRPTNVGGRIAWAIAPSSQEAMAWHAATHRGDYECDRGRVELQYFYPKPYEALRIGTRPKPDSADAKTRAEVEDREVTFDGPAIDPIDTEDELQDMTDDGKVLDGADLSDGEFPPVQVDPLERGFE